MKNLVWSAELWYVGIHLTPSYPTPVEVTTRYLREQAEDQELGAVHFSDICSKKKAIMKLSSINSCFVYFVTLVYLCHTFIYIIKGVEHRQKIQRRHDSVIVGKWLHVTNEYRLLPIYFSQRFMVTVHMTYLRCELSRCISSGLNTLPSCKGLASSFQICDLDS